MKIRVSDVQSVYTSEASYFANFPPIKYSTNWKKFTFGNESWNSNISTVRQVPTVYHKYANAKCH